MPRNVKQIEVDTEHILEELISLLDKLGINVKYDRGNFLGGLVKYEDNDYFYINRKAKTETKINTIVDELKNLKIPPGYIKGDLKQYFDDKRSDTEN
jgi:hypothetical protein